MQVINIERRVVYSMFLLFLSIITHEIATARATTIIVGYANTPIESHNPAEIDKKIRLLLLSYSLSQ